MELSESLLRLRLFGRIISDSLEDVLLGGNGGKGKFGGFCHIPSMRRIVPGVLGAMGI